jgi:DNA-binding transcriptional LysR family regulator
MLRRLPALNALKSFEAAARYESFTRAAEELCVTQGAVSHQVKALEAELGVKTAIGRGSTSNACAPSTCSLYAAPSF